MKKLKFLILFLLIVFLTGCDVTYNLEITEDTITESASFLLPNTPENFSITEQYLKSKRRAYMDESKTTHYYEQKQIQDEDNVGINLKYIYPADKISDSSLINYCYDGSYITRNEDEIIINTKERISCLYMDDNTNFDSLTINIKTDLEVAENNADKVNGNVYSWVITKENYNNHPINMKILFKSNNNIIDYFVLIILIGIALVIGLIVYFIVKVKQKNSNAF